MAFYDGLGKRIQQTGQGAIDRTKRSAEVARLNSSINNLEKEASKEYTELGEAYYRKFAGTGAYDADMTSYFQNIDGLKEQIEDCKAQIRSLKGFQKCPRCGQDVDATAMFCSFCGEKLEPVAAESSGGKAVCPNCGALLEDDQIFCTVCGTKLEQAAQAAAPEPEFEPDLRYDDESVGAGTDTDSDFTVEKILFCPGCGMAVRENEEFCSKCGRKLDITIV